MISKVKQDKISNVISQQIYDFQSIWLRWKGVKNKIAFNINTQHSTSSCTEFIRGQ